MKISVQIECLTVLVQPLKEPLQTFFAFFHKNSGNLSFSAAGQLVSSVRGPRRRFSRGSNEGQSQVNRLQPFSNCFLHFLPFDDRRRRRWRRRRRRTSTDGWRGGPCDRRRPENLPTSSDSHSNAQPTNLIHYFDSCSDCFSSISLFKKWPLAFLSKLGPGVVVQFLKEPLPQKQEPIL